MAIFPQGYQNIAARCRNTEDGGAERRVLRQLQRCLEDDYLVWHNVPVGNKGRLPDFVVLHPGRGLLVLEVKGWRAGALHQVSRHDVELNLANGQRVRLKPARIRLFAPEPRPAGPTSLVGLDGEGI